MTYIIYNFEDKKIISYHDDLREAVVALAEYYKQGFCYFVTSYNRYMEIVV